MASVTRHAILIGVNSPALDPSDDPVQGSINDVRAMYEILQNETHKVNIKILAGTRQDGNSEQALNPIPGTILPTLNNVTSIIRETRANARQGDRVYIHYSGHGTVEDPDESWLYTNKFKGDLGLLLLDDEDPSKFDVLSGVRLANALNAMWRDKGLIVTLVLDCCFSGSVYRQEWQQGDGNGKLSVSAARYLPPNGNRALKSWKKQEDTGESALASQDRSMSMSSNWLMNPEGYSILVACRQDETAGEVETEGEYFGKLSFILHELLEGQGLQISLRDVYRHLRARFWEGVGENRQTPIVYGNDHQIFFGSGLETSTDATKSAMLIPVVDNAKTGHLTLLAGRAHGLCESDELVICDSSGDAEGDKAATEIVGINTIGVVTSVLCTRSKDGRILRGRYRTAIPRRQRLLEAYLVHLDGGFGSRDIWERKLSHRSMTATSEDNDKGYDFLVKTVKDGTVDGPSRFQIMDRSGEEISNLPPLPETHTSIDDVVEILHHMTRYQLTLDLTSDNPASWQATLWRDSFDVFVTTLDGKIYEKGSIIEVEEPDEDKHTIELHIQNNGSKNIYAYIFALDDEFKVQNALEATCAVIRPASSQDEYRGYSTSMTEKMDFRVPDKRRGVEGGLKYCKDEVKVIVISHMTSLDIHEQPRLWIYERGEELDDHGTDRSEESPLTTEQHWAAFRFTVKTMVSQDKGSYKGSESR